MGAGITLYRGQGGGWVLIILHVGHERCVLVLLHVGQGVGWMLK